MRKTALMNQPLILKCRNGKWTYQTKDDADAALKWIQAQRDGRPKPIRSYECHWCGFWHLTSKDQNLRRERLRREQEYRVRRLAEEWKRKLGIEE